MWSDGIVRKAEEWVNNPQLDKAIAAAVIRRWHISSASRSQRANEFFGSLENVVKAVEERLDCQIVLQENNLQAKLVYQEVVTSVSLSGTELGWFLEKLKDEVDNVPHHVLACKDRFCFLDGKYYLAEEITKELVVGALHQLIKAAGVSGDKWVSNILPDLKEIFSRR